jgi:hypothetical protein
VNDRRCDSRPSNFLDAPHLAALRGRRSAGMADVVQLICQYRSLSLKSPGTNPCLLPLQYFNADVE